MHAGGYFDGLGEGEALIRAVAPHGHAVYEAHVDRGVDILGVPAAHGHVAERERGGGGVRAADEQGGGGGGGDCGAGVLTDDVHLVLIHASVFGLAADADVEESAGGYTDRGGAGEQRNGGALLEAQHLTGGEGHARRAACLTRLLEGGAQGGLYAVRGILDQGVCPAVGIALGHQRVRGAARRGGGHGAAEQQQRQSEDEQTLTHGVSHHFWFLAAAAASASMRSER